MECKKFIVTTTISQPTEATHKFIDICYRDDWNMIVIGDLKTPHEDYRHLAEKYPDRFAYISPTAQELSYNELSAAIGWNKIMRRNLGFCEAFRLDADIIATVDDDNIPYDDWGKNLMLGKEVIVDCYEAKNGVFDPLSVTNANYMWHRGYPSELIPSRLDIVYKGKIKRKPLIQADLWDGVPDVDAMNRIIHNPRLKLNVTDPYCSINIAPFNSQNTFLSREIIPYYMVLPHAGRMDDIWASYMIQKQFPNSVVFNKATVYQERHEPHSRNMKDLKDETMGYEFTLKFINGEFPLPDDSQLAYDLYRNTMKNLMV